MVTLYGLETIEGGKLRLPVMRSGGNNQKIVGRIVTNCMFIETELHLLLRYSMFYLLMSQIGGIGSEGDYNWPSHKVERRYTLTC